MFIQNDNDEEILDFLTDNNYKLEDFKKDKVISFYYEKDYNLLLFFSKDGDKGFQLFTVKDVKSNPTDLQLLKDFFTGLLNVTLEKGMIEKSIKQIDTQLIAVSAVNLFERKK